MTKATRLTGVAMLIVGFAAAVWGWSNTGAADPAEPANSPVAKAADPVRALQKERLAALESILDLVRKEHAAGRTTGMEVEEAVAEVLRARLELSESSQERIAICEESVKLAESRVRMAEARFKTAVGQPSDVLRSKIGLLDAKIALEKEKAAAH